MSTNESLTINSKMYLVKDLFSDKIERIPTRNGYGDGVADAGKRNKNVIVLCADLTESTKSHIFKKNFPDRFIEAGVAEQNLAVMGAGLAAVGKIPFISSYAMFNPGRNWEQIRTAICYSKRNVKIIGAHAGVSVGPDGATHQALEDIAITRVLPNMTVIVPCDYYESYKATIAAAKHKGPIYIRFAREKTPVFTTKKTPFEIGKAQKLVEGKDVCIIACGPLVHESLKAANELKKKKISVGVINCHTIKPLDKKTIIEAAKKYKAIVTVEEHQITGGLSGAISELLSENYPVPIIRVGVNDRFGESGKPDELLKAFKLTSPAICIAVNRSIALKRKK